MEEVISSTVPFKNAVNARDEVYAGMNKYATRIINALAASGALPDIVKDARGIVNKITGKRTGKIDPDNPDEKTISTSQLGFDNRKANFELLVALVKGEPEYNPNEDDLKPLALDAYIADLGTLNTTVNNTLVALQAKRTDRNEALYAPVTGASELAKKVKSYEKSVLGASSPVYKRIAAIRFTTMKL
jgi:hypothetical protein